MCADVGGAPLGSPFVKLHPAAAKGFASNADDYERARPSYPPDAVEHLVSTLGLAPGRTVVDVAAGTGKLTRLLVASGARVVAVEPIAEMRAKLSGTAPTAEALDGTAERLPLADATADAITVAQAFHWLDGPAALAEFHRVLRPGGALAVVYNERDRTVGWMARLNRLLEEYRGDTPQQWDGRWRNAFATTELFGPLEESAFDNPHTLSPEEVIGRFRSLSFVGALDGSSQGRLLAGIAKLLASDPDTSGRTELVMPQRTVVSTCRWR